MRWSRAQVLAYQQQALRRLLAHTAQHSEFYRRHWKGLDPATAPLEAFPPVDKQLLTENFDAVVTDRRVTREQLHRHVFGPDADQLFLGRYRAYLTTGHSGFRTLMLYSPEEMRWCYAVAGRLFDLAGVRLRKFPLRLASLRGGTVAHVGSETKRAAMFGFRPLDVLTTQPVADMVGTLNRFQPHVVKALSLVLGDMAREQLAGRLRIAPLALISSGHKLLPEVSALVKQAWGAPLIDLYGMTEGATASTCACGQLAVYDDFCIIEVVDRQGRSFPPGTPGQRILVTNLVAKTFPLIRYSVEDVLVLESGAPRCGSPFTHLRSVEGRDDEVLYFPAADGRVQPVFPGFFNTTVGMMPPVRQFEAVQRIDGLTITLVPEPGADPAAVAEAALNLLAGAFRERELLVPAIRTVVVDTIPPAPGGSHKVARTRREVPPPGDARNG
jgi:putative adenylate-forming enzyme